MESAPTLIAVSLAAFGLPLLAARVRAPAAVLEILFGVLVGDSVLGLLEGSALLDQLALLGFFLLMFLSGFEIDLGGMSRQGRGPLVTASAVFVLTVACAFLATRVLGYNTFVVFVLATTSLGLVVPTLRSVRRSATPLGQSVLLAAILADFLTLIGVTVFAVVEEHGGGVGLANVPVFVALALTAVVVLHRVAWWYPEWFERFFRSDDPDELGIRAALALMLAFAGLAELLGIEPILGAFLSGVAFTFVFRQPGALERKLGGFAYGFFIPLFFINVGIGLDASVLTNPSVLAGDLLPLLVAAALVKLLPALLLMQRGLALRETLAAGALLSARLSLIIAVSDLGVRLGLIDPELESVIVALATISAFASPTVFRALAPPLPVQPERLQPRADFRPISRGAIPSRSRPFG